MPTWISVDDRLPEDQSLVLVYRDSPEDAEVMKFIAPKTFTDLHGNSWPVGVVSSWAEE